VTKSYVRLEFLIDSYLKVPCKFCLNSKVDENKMCHACILSKKSRIERDERFLEVQNSDWNKKALLNNAHRKSVMNRTKFYEEN
jgi:hypothetical protein